MFDSVSTTGNFDQGGLAIPEEKFMNDHYASKPFLQTILKPFCGGWHF